MAKTLKEELEDIAGPGMTDMRRVGKWLEILTMHVVALEARAVAPGGPAPLPIETAPLGTILTLCAEDDEPEWQSETSDGKTLEEWRTGLKKWGRTHWLPMPPPPGGGK